MARDRVEKACTNTQHDRKQVKLPSPTFRSLALLFCSPVVFPLWRKSRIPPSISKSRQVTICARPDPGHSPDVLMLCRRRPPRRGMVKNAGFADATVSGQSALHMMWDPSVSPSQIYDLVFTTCSGKAVPSLPFRKVRVTAKSAWRKKYPPS